MVKRQSLYKVSWILSDDTTVNHIKLCIQELINISDGMIMMMIKIILILWNSVLRYTGKR